MGLELGIFVVPDATDAAATVAQIIEAERAGLDMVGVQDHPYQWRFFDTWTLLAYVAGRTEHVRFVPDVLNLPLRLPAMIAVPYPTGHPEASPLDRLLAGSGWTIRADAATVMTAATTAVPPAASGPQPWPASAAVEIDAEPDAAITKVVQASSAMGPSSPRTCTARASANGTPAPSASP